MKTKNENLFHYQDCGLDNVYLSGGFEKVDSPYGSGVTIQHLDGLHRCIANLLVNKPAPLTGAEFRFLRTELDYSQLFIGEMFGRTARQVRNWENGSKSIDEPMNSMIRFIYKERWEPRETYEHFSNAIRKAQAWDKEIHELKLIATTEGWESANCG